MITLGLQYDTAAPEGRKIRGARKFKIKTGHFGGKVNLIVNHKNRGGGGAWAPPPLLRGPLQQWFLRCQPSNNYTNSMSCRSISFDLFSERGCSTLSQPPVTVHWGTSASALRAQRVPPEQVWYNGRSMNHIILGTVLVKWPSRHIFTSGSSAHNIFTSGSCRPSVLHPAAQSQCMLFYYSNENKRYPYLVINFII